MLKSLTDHFEIAASAEAALRGLVDRVPVIQLNEIRHESPAGNGHPDFLADITASGRRHLLVCEAKSSGQPRHARIAILELRQYVSNLGKNVTPIFIAPYLSPASRGMCREEGVGFVDFEGNAWIAFDSVFIERTVADRSPVEKRELKSIFKPKASQVLKVLLRDPSRPWLITELADAAGVSLGHASNVRQKLLNREWANASEVGLVLSGPNALLDAWRRIYESPSGKRLAFYTARHGSSLEESARRVLSVDPHSGRAIFASFSAAHWLAPYGRSGTQYFYADHRGLQNLQQALSLSTPQKGENVVVTVPAVDSLFLDTVEPAPGSVCTGLIQTYLDLAIAGERGQEAADHLRTQHLAWTK